MTTVKLPKTFAKHPIIWLFVIPIVGFALAMHLFPQYKTQIFAAEILSPIPPFP